MMAARVLAYSRTSPPTRAIENDVLSTAQRHGLGVLSYSPLAGGWRR